MATPDTNYPLRESVGSLTLFIAKFAAMTDGGTWDTGLGSNIVGYWANSETNETAGEEGVNVSNSAGTLTFGVKQTSIITAYALARV